MRDLQLPPTNPQPLRVNAIFLFEEEQAKVDAIRAPIDAVVEKDLWPRELYFSGI